MCVCVYVCVWMYGCIDVWMYGCMDVWMYGCDGCDVWMYGCMDVWMYGCMDVWMYGCMDVWMYGCMDVWMYGRLRNPEASCGQLPSPPHPTLQCAGLDSRSRASVTIGSEAVVSLAVRVAPASLLLQASAIRLPGSRPGETPALRWKIGVALRLPWLQNRSARLVSDRGRPEGRGEGALRS